MRRRRRMRSSSHMGCQASPSRMVGQPRNLGKCRHMNDSVIPERGFDNEGNSRACAAVHTPDQSSGKLTDSDIEGPSSAQGTKEQLLSVQPKCRRYLCSWYINTSHSATILLLILRLIGMIRSINGTVTWCLADVLFCHRRC